jgi:hypothetical protein
MKAEKVFVGSNATPGGRDTVVEKAPIAGGTGGAGVNIVRPDVSRMVLYDPRQGFGIPQPGQTLPIPPHARMAAGMQFVPPLLGLHPSAPQLIQGRLPPGIVPPTGKQSCSSR